LLYALSMSLGIAALVAMGSFGSDLGQAVDEETRELLGADLMVWNRQPFEPEIEEFFQTIPGEQTRITGFASMAFFPRVQQAQLSRVRGVAGNFPFYGQIETTPPEAAQTYQSGPNALVSSILIERMGLAIGDEVRVGERRFRISGIVENVPGESAMTALFGPRIYVPHRYLEDTGLLQRGSRIYYWRAFKTSADVDTIVAENEDLLRAHRLGWDTVATRKESMGEGMAQLSHFLDLVACLTLLLGGLGVAGAVHYHIKQKTTQVAVMRCLGATVGQVVAVYLLQVLAMALLAILIGTVVGVALQFYFPVLVAASWGLLMSLLLAAAPLLAIRRMSPLLSFRPDAIDRSRDRLVWLTYAGVAATWWIFAVIRTESWLRGSIFIGSLLAALLLLWATARLLGWGARRILSPKLPFAPRYALAHLFRPQNQTSVFLIILGMGIFLVTILAGSRSMLLAPFSASAAGDRPNFIAFDIQPDQVASVREKMLEHGLQPGPATPMVPMRISAVAGRSVPELLAEGEMPEWALQREYRSTYRGSLTETEALVDGDLVPMVTADTDPVPVSFERDLLEMLQIGIGDRVTVDILGVPLELVVASVRRVDWQSFQPNFYMVFPEGVLEEAPGSFVITSRTTDVAQIASVQSAVVAAHPNVTCVDMTAMVQNIDKLTAEVMTVIRFLAGLCIATGFLLLGSAVWNARYERLAEHALLRTLGAGRRQMATITLIEYFLLGLFASLTGLILAVAANWGLGVFLFEVPPFPEPLALFPAALALPFITLALGYLSLRGVWNAPPRLVLRGK